MKKIKTYLNKREETLFQLLERERKYFEPITYNKLCIEIRKIMALLELMSYSKEKVDVKRILKPFKKIYEQAEIIKGLQDREAMLKRFIPGPLLKSFRTDVRRDKLNKIQIFFELPESSIGKKIRKRFLKLNDAADDISRKKGNAFLEKSRKKIEKILKTENPVTTTYHELKDKMEGYQTLTDCIQPNEEKTHIEKRANLSDLLNRYFDFEVMLGFIEEMAIIHGIPKVEAKPIEKIRTDLLARLELVKNSIEIAISEGLFFSQKAEEI